MIRVKIKLQTIQVYGLTPLGDPEGVETVISERMIDRYQRALKDFDFVQREFRMIVKGQKND